MACRLRGDPLSILFNWLTSAFWSDILVLGYDILVLGHGFGDAHRGREAESAKTSYERVVRNHVFCRLREIAVSAHLRRHAHDRCLVVSFCRCRGRPLIWSGRLTGGVVARDLRIGSA